MQTVCPITNKITDERVARLNGAFTVIFVALFIFLNWWWGMLFLAIDFFIRGFVDGKYSVLTQISKLLSNLFFRSPKRINAGPKIFAAQVGLMLSVLALLTFFIGCNWLCLVIAGVLGFFSLLESSLGFCVACKLYPFFRKIS